MCLCVWGGGIWNREVSQCKDACPGWDMQGELEVVRPMRGCSIMQKIVFD